MAVQKDRNIRIDYGDPEVTKGVSVLSQQFDELYVYDGADLGLTYTPAHSSFRLWAPTASKAYVLLYSDWHSETPERHPMRRDVKGTWVLQVDEDLAGRYYTYLVQVGEQWNEACDPYATAVGVNGDRAAIVDLQTTNPKRWKAERPPLAHPVDAIIYELHIRDYTIHPGSGVRQKGRYLGLTEPGTKGPAQIATGLDHLTQLGVTHVQLMPVFDYATESVDETRLHEPQYNWGYDPKNYNVPEGSYATDPYKPEVRIRELKTLIQTLHDHGLRVIMDVVYNHVYDGYVIHFTKLVPGYYLRYKPDGSMSNGSGCGNDCATERPMMRKYIVDSVLHWAREYHIDGFRFDLMGLIDVDTMNELRRRLDQIDPSILMLGEGWVMDTELPDNERANQSHAPRMARVAHFNGDLRDAVKGEVFDEAKPGFVNGGTGFETRVKQAVAGAITYSEQLRSFAAEPDQCVNYAECHDNHTMWDKLSLSAKDAPEEERRAMHRLATAIVLTCQGIPFLHAGQEFYRTKHGVDNSFNAGDEVNRIDWEAAAAHQADVRAVRELIELRRRHPAFRMRSAEQIRKHLRFEEGPAHTVAYTLRDHANGERYRHLYVLYHTRSGVTRLALPPLGSWEPVFGAAHIEHQTSDTLTVRGIGMVILGCDR
ncbi:type I pullulanase [Paenibacillus sp. FSL M8-0334]|uniref:type I pullulanase n=2 Tax=Paenibacillus TaxID=44249 RepID=UPI0030F6FA37